jgi:hypothetical protein
MSRHVTFGMPRERAALDFMSPTHLQETLFPFNMEWPWAEWFKHHAMTTSKIFKMGGKWGLQELPLLFRGKRPRRRKRNEE